MNHKFSQISCLTNTFLYIVNFNFYVKPCKKPLFDFRISPYSILMYLLLFSYLLLVTINRRYIPVRCLVKA